MAITNTGTISGFGVLTDLINNNLIDVSGGIREISGVLSSTLPGGGTIGIEANSKFQIDAAASNNNVSFKASTGTLTILQLGSVASNFDIVNISSSDVIRLPNAPVGFGLNYNTNTGTLAITSGGATIGSLVFTPSPSLSTAFFQSVFVPNLTVAARPVVAIDAGLNVAVGGTGTITSGALLTTESGATPSQLTYTVTGAPAAGAILNNGSAVSTFTQADINAGLIAYQESGSPAPSDAIGFRVTDPNGYSANGSFPITIASETLAAPVLEVNAGVTVSVEWLRDDHRGCVTDHRNRRHAGGKLTYHCDQPPGGWRDTEKRHRGDDLHAGRHQCRLHRVSGERHRRDVGRDRF